MKENVFNCYWIDRLTDCILVPKILLDKIKSNICKNKMQIKL